MRAQPRPVEFDGQPVRRPTRPAARPADGLYRYKPVPPAYRDADGYLVEDGMTQSLHHQRGTSQWCYLLTRHLPAATVASDLALHYRKDDQDATIVPDLFVALRAPPLRENRTSYKLWEYPLPELVVEMLSGSNPGKDVGPKRDTYEYLGVDEYWLFDPAGLKLATPLVGYRMHSGRYRPIAADAAGQWRSEVLGLDLYVCDDELRFRDPATGEDLRTYDESEDRGDAAEGARIAAERRADTERDRADAAEQEQAAANDRADAAERGQAAEKDRADAAEREVARLRLQLKDS